MKGEYWMDIRSDRQKGLSYVELGKSTTWIRERQRGTRIRL